MRAAGTRTRLPAAAAIVAGSLLAAQSADEALALAQRLWPVLLFVAAMSVTVNLAAADGAFDAIAGRLARNRPGVLATWTGVVALAVVSTVFLSLDTTAIMVTPLAVALARRSGADAVALGLAVVWIANVGSLLLPVSNLTNLMAVAGGSFRGTADYVAVMWRPALVALLLAVAAAAVVTLWSRRRPATGPGPLDPGWVREPGGAPEPDGGHRPTVSLVVLGILLPALVSPVPYWLSATTAAAVLTARGAWRTRGLSVRRRTTGLLRQIPWTALALVTTLSALAAVIHAAGADDWIGAWVERNEGDGGGLIAISVVGAALANVVNNIPAFLALDVGSGHGATAALLVGVNAGPIITPWASLATLLWHDQLRRAGVTVTWRRFVVLGALLAPVVVVVPVLTL
ncbi:SLC13 family permease [Gordonia shandongensis]|uniref:SLC13 family permease n=1 Tax=Gordonia shandongensis TaxID=376351 RepID=UPI0003FBB2FC|nr:SLC13 family permease [Gordonia shandongensis]